ncbi:CPXCG motif-containing cysteine-rich protein [Bdellovibrio sp. SKB1291214]|uniref:CPXCG motif-containing cysteine-rich protein n=1 Tax=Bdellovibrio sp. SKB1291214 TaxID=1732569 RepID=UPI000B51D9A5|nr:CPXCG motif-containing cysteine-rich protein [Bdellovibrio sp. SKB1291214]UYL08601.1 CPXCG motif-containing cysteine-rich protein [Bdellovibrio sp. SKB1291214]
MTSPEFESFDNAEIEQYFQCPYCHQAISMLVDISEPGRQIYIEDCEVCCKPIQIAYSTDQGRLVDFSAQRI